MRPMRDSSGLLGLIGKTWLPSLGSTGSFKHLPFNEVAGWQTGWLLRHLDDTALHPETVPWGQIPSSASQRGLGTALSEVSFQIPEMPCDRDHLRTLIEVHRMAQVLIMVEDMFLNPFAPI